MTLPVLKAIAEHRIVPVVVIPEARQAEPLADALETGGLPCAEITFRTAAAAEAIAALAKRPGMLVGSGTVLTVDQAKQAAGVGARFVVSPGFNASVVEWCLANRMPVFPGVATPTEIQAALAYGLEVLKFFPAGALGGLPALKAISAPFGGVRYMPTGGVSEDNLADYLAWPGTIACGGTWLASAELLRAHDYQAIAGRCQAAVAIAGRFGH